MANDNLPRGNVSTTLSTAVVSATPSTNSHLAMDAAMPDPKTNVPRIGQSGSGAIIPSGHASDASALSIRQPDLAGVGSALLDLQETMRRFSSMARPAETIMAHSRMSADLSSTRSVIAESISAFQAHADLSSTRISAMVGASTHLSDALNLATAKGVSALSSIHGIGDTMTSLSRMLDPWRSSLEATSLRIDGTLRSFISAADISSRCATLDLSVPSSIFSESGPRQLTISQLVIPSYLSATASVFDAESRLASATSLATADTAWRSTLTELHGSLSGLANVTQDFSREFEQISGQVISFSESWIRRPALELYTAALATASISADQEVGTDIDLERSLDEEVAGFEVRIAALHPELLTTYRGGVEALSRGATDWRRHTMVSFRELATHALHILAPDNEVARIATEADMVNGRFTRNARFRYIFSGVGNGSMARFVEADMKAAMELFNILNQTTHQLGSNASPAQIRYLRSRLVGLITSMLDAQNR